MGRRSRRQRAARLQWKIRRNIHYDQYIQKYRTTFPVVPYPCNKSSGSHTPRSTLHKRNAHLKQIAEAIHGADGTEYGLLKLLQQNYPDIITHFMKTIWKDLLCDLRAACDTSAFKWKCIGVKYTLHLSNINYNLLRKHLMAPVDTTIGEYSMCIPTLGKLDKLITESVKFPIFQQLEGVVGRFWALPNMIQEWTKLHLTLETKRKELVWFKNKEFHFVWAVALDGSPETHDVGKVVVCCAPWNLGEKLHCRDEWTVIFAYDGKEQGPEMENFCGKLKIWIKEIEAKPLMIGEIATTHEFIPAADQKMLAYIGGQYGQNFSKFSIWGAVSKTNKINPHGKLGEGDWILFTQQLRENEGKLAKEKSLEIEVECAYLKKETRDKKLSDYVKQSLVSAQKNIPLLDVSKSVPDGTHDDCNAAKQWLSHVVSFSLAAKTSTSDPTYGTLSKLISTLEKLSLSSVASKLAKKYINNLEKNTNKKLGDTKWRLIGRNAISIMKNFRLIVLSTLPSSATQNHLTQIQILFVLGRLLRDISFHYSSRTTSEDMLKVLDNLCFQYYAAHCIFFPASAITPTVFTIGKVVPWAARQVWERYGVGLGYNLLQAPESVNALTNSLLEDTNWSLKGNDKWLQVMEHLYIVQFVLPQYSPVIMEHKPRHGMRIEAKDGNCWCGIKIEDDGCSRCRFCTHLAEIEYLISPENVPLNLQTQLYFT